MYTFSKIVNCKYMYQEISYALKKVSNAACMLTIDSEYGLCIDHLSTN